MFHIDILLQAFCINSVFFFFFNGINLYGVNIQILTLE